MVLNIEGDVIVLNILDNIKKYQVSQLKYFGYQYSKNAYIKQSDNLALDIQKILNYFEGEGTNVQLTPIAQEIFSDIQSRKANKQFLFEKARKIQNGEFDSETLTEFVGYLKTLPRKLKSHQIKAAYHLYSLQNGANFSVPGSGKTSVVLSVYEKLRLEGKINAIYVVGPPSSFQPWQHEFKETLGRNPKVTLLSGGDKESRKNQYYMSLNDIAELYLSTYQTILNDSEDVIKFLRQKSIDVFFVIDEAHYMKRLDGSWANSLLQIAKFTKVRCILTGTPIPKSYTDLFNLFDFLWLDDSPISENDKIKIMLWEKQKNNEAAQSLLDDKIGPLFYRVRKKDLNLKPAVFHPPIIIGMNSYELRIYTLIKSRIRDLSSEDYFQNESVLHKLWKGRMMRLRQAASYPKLLLRAIEDYEEDLLTDNSEIAEIIQNYDTLEIPGKLNHLTKKVFALQENNEKVLIWSNFVGTLQLIRNHFLNLGLRCELIYGQTPTKKNSPTKLKEELTREEIRDAFVNPNSGLDVLIANPAAFAESVSLHKTCYHAIYYDLSYNAAQYLQSLDRIHRVGGSEFKTANYYFLQYEQSIDQDIKTNLEQKAQKMYALIEKDYEIYDLDMFEETDDDIAAYKRLFHTN